MPVGVQGRDHYDRHLCRLWLIGGSPGLQAAGGVVELVGGGILAYERWRGTKEDLERAENEVKYQKHMMKQKRVEKFMEAQNPTLSRIETAAYWKRLSMIGK
jgi:hypothetical protein